MVCLGNICRSPLAEGILKHKVEKLGLSWEVDSAGTAGYHVGEKPDSRSIQVAQQNGIDITYQRSRKVTKEDLEIFDLIFAMDSSNHEDLLYLARNNEQKKKIKMILNESNPGQNNDVPDPYYGGVKGFTNVFNMLDEACDKIIENYAY